MAGNTSGARATLITLEGARVELRLHRRRQMVVVRAGDSQDIPLSAHPRRRRLRTLPGLDQRERLETLTEELCDVEPQVSRARPTVLVDGIDDARALEYRREAERILREGRLSSDD